MIKGVVFPILDILLILPPEVTKKVLGEEEEVQIGAETVELLTVDHMGPGDTFLLNHAKRKCLGKY